MIANTIESGWLNLTDIWPNMALHHPLMCHYVIFSVR